jgi:hypothetical protein
MVDTAPEEWSAGGSGGSLAAAEIADGRGLVAALALGAEG